MPDPAVPDQPGSPDAEPGNAPVNIARPQWQCPHCKHNYHSDLDTATACAQAGPPAPAPAGVAVLVLPSHQTTSAKHGAAFGLSEAGPVKAETVDGQRRHRRDLTVDGTVVDARLLEVHGRLAAPGELVVLASTRPLEPNYGPARIGPSGYGLLDRLFRGEQSYSAHAANLPVWVLPGSRTWDEGVWLRPPDDMERDVLNMLTGGLLTAAADADVDTFTGEIETAYRTRRRHGSHTGRRLLAAPESALLLAAAHGAPSHIWALKWLSRHVSQIARWQAQTAIAWAAGAGEPMPIAVTLPLSDKLPNNPGKKRLAQMEPYGTDDYRQTLKALVDLMTVDAPLRPVPGLGDVAAELRTTGKGSHRAP